MVQTVSKTPTEQRCIVLRPIFVGGQRLEVGAPLTLPLHTFAELRAAGKVAAAQASAQADAPPVEPPPAEDTTAPRARRAKE